MKAFSQNPSDNHGYDFRWIILACARKYDAPYLPDEFVENLKRIAKSYNRPKAEFLYDAGLILYENNFLNLALATLHSTLYLVHGNKVWAGEGKCYLALGRVNSKLGDFEQAITCLNKALEIFKKLKRPALKAKCYVNIGNVLNEMGDFQLAIKKQKEALKICRKEEDELGKATCYVGIGIGYDSLGKFKRALSYHELALSIYLKNTEKAGKTDIPNCYLNIGNAHDGLGHFQQAIRYYKKALRIFKKNSDKESMAKCYRSIGAAYASLGHFQRAIRYQKKGIETYSGNLRNQLRAYFNLGKTYSKAGKFGLSFKFLKRSIDLSEEIGQNLVSDYLKIRFYADVSLACQSIVPVCLKIGKGKMALEYSEKCRSRALLDILAATDIKPTVELNRQLQSLLNREKVYRRDIRIVQGLRQKEPMLARLGALEGLRRKLEVIYREIEGIDPEYAYLRQGKALPTDRILKIVKSERKQVVLFEYFTTDEETIIFVISSRENEVRWITVPLSLEKRNQFIEKYWAEVVLQPYPELRRSGSSWMELGKYLLDPVADYLHAEDIVYFVPHRLLHYFPLHALQFEGKPLIENNPVAYSPSATLLEFCRKKGSGKLDNCAFFGVDFTDEAIELADLMKQTPILDFQVTKDNVIERCEKADIIHFSCHGNFNAQYPLFSGIMLYNNQSLTARDIFDMRINPELVTLSCCQSGLASHGKGDDLMGLTRAFIYAGTPTAIVGLWEVRADSTIELMKKFYFLLKQGNEKVVALREAQRFIMKECEFDHPFYWAPFKLVGDWE